MKFLLCGCFHGRVPKKLIFVAKKEKVDYILSTGDFNNADRIRKIVFKNFNSDKSFEEIVGKRKSNLLIRKSVLTGSKVLKKLNSLGIPILTTYGNNDESSRFPIRRGEKPNKKNDIETLIKGLKNIEFKDYDFKKIGDYEFYFVGVKFPRKGKKRNYKKYFRYKIGLTENKNLSKFFGKVDSKKTILITHEPPRDTKFDKVINKESPANGIHLGDYVVRDIIKKHKPFLHISGHMHEHQGKQKLGKTLLISHGAAQFGKFALLELEKDKIKKLRFYG